MTSAYLPSPSACMRRARDASGRTGRRGNGRAGYALAACGTAAPEVPAAEPSPAPVIQVPTAGPGDGAIQSHLATKVLEVGTQRVAFLLNTQKALVKAPQVSISVAPTDESGPATEITADYNAWPYGVRGSYVAPVYFPSPGDYRLTVMPVGGEVSGEAVIDVSVVADSPIPSVGEAAPSSETKTLDDTAEITDLTTAYEPDSELYRISVAEAVESGKPSVLVFATPAFCTSPRAVHRWIPCRNCGSSIRTRPITSTWSFTTTPRRYRET